MTHYKDKDKEFDAYRMALLGRSVGVVLALIIAVTACFPNMPQLLMCLVCLVATLCAFVYHILADRTLVHTGQFLIEDGEALYIVVGTFGLGFGRSYHRSEKHISVYRYSYIYGVKKIKQYPFGIALRAKVCTATSKDIDAGREVFDSPGEMKRLLLDKGKKRTVLFRIEHNLLPEEEERLIQNLQSLQDRGKDDPA